MTTPTPDSIEDKRKYLVSCDWENASDECVTDVWNAIHDAPSLKRPTPTPPEVSHGTECKCLDCTTWCLQGRIDRQELLGLTRAYTK